MDELFHNRSVAFISLDPYGMLGVTVIFSSGRIDGSWIIINVFLRGTKQPAFVKILSLQRLLLSVTVNGQITQTLYFLPWLKNRSKWKRSIVSMSSRYWKVNSIFSITSRQASTEAKAAACSRAVVWGGENTVLPSPRRPTCFIWHFVRATLKFAGWISKVKHGFPRDTIYSERKQRL